MKTLKKERFQKLFRKRYALRFHMAAILITTALSGVIISKALLVLGLESLALRYALTVVLSYLIFFVCVKLWLFYVSPRKAGSSRSPDWLDIPTPSGGSSTEGLSPIHTIHGGGGQFSGGGASGSFDVRMPAVADTPLSSATDAVPNGASGIGDAIGGAVDGLGDEGGIAVIIALAVLAAIVATILGGAAYVIMEAPVILSEAAFEGLLAASLMKSTRLIDSNEWVGSIFKATWKPFAITLAVVIFGGLVLHAYFPEAHRLADIIRKG